MNRAASVPESKEDAWQYWAACADSRKKYPRPPVQHWMIYRPICQRSLGSWANSWDVCVERGFVNWKRTFRRRSKNRSAVRCC